VIIIAATIQLYPEKYYQEGLTIVTVPTTRNLVNSVNPAIKSLNYLNNILAKIESIDAGCLEAIMLNTAGEVSECTGDNIFAIKGGRIATPPTSAGILHGITRQFVIDELAPALGIPVEVRRLEVDDVLGADEVFLTGTAAEIIGVSAIGDRVIGAGRMGPLTERLEAEFRRRILAGAPED